MILENPQKSVFEQGSLLRSGKRSLKMIIMFVVFCFAGMIVQSATYEGKLLSVNLLPKNAFYAACQVSDPRLCWGPHRAGDEKNPYREANPAWGFEIHEGLLRLKSNGEDSFNRVYLGALQWSPIQNNAIKYELSCDARLLGEGEADTICGVDSFVGHGSSRVFPFSKLGSDWKHYDFSFSLPCQIDYIWKPGLKIEFGVKGDNAVLELKDVVLKPVFAPLYNEDKLLLDDSQVKGVYLLVEKPGKAHYNRKSSLWLTRWIHEICGANIPIYELDELPKDFDKKGKILVGDIAIESGLITKEEYASVGNGGYVIRCVDGSLGICGKWDGVMVAVKELLNQCGWICQKDRCVDFKRMDQLVFSDKFLVRTPAYSMRMPCDDRAPSWARGASDFDLISLPSRIGCPSLGTHTTSLIYKSLATHPEWIAMDKEGKREIPKVLGFLQLCVSNSELQRFYGKMVDAWMDAMPEAEFFHVGQGDGYGFCQCADCKVLDKSPDHLADRHWKFVNAVAEEVEKKHPDKTILTLAYNKFTEAPPEKFQPAKNVWAQYCTYPQNWMCHLHGQNCPHNCKGKGTIESWFSKYPGVLYIFDYNECYPEKLSLFFPFYADQQKIRYFFNHDIKGYYSCGSPRFLAATFQTVVPEMLWNPDIDLDKAVDRQMASYYGPASPWMLKLFYLVSKRIKEGRIHHACEYVNHHYITDCFATEAYALLDSAIKAVVDKPRLKERVLDDKLCVLFSDLNERNQRNGKAGDLDVYAAKLAEFVHLRRNGGRDLSWFSMGRAAGTLREWIEKTTFLKVANLSDHEFNQLMKEPLDALKTAMPVLRQEKALRIKLPKGTKSYRYAQSPLTTYFQIDSKPEGALTLCLTGRIECHKEPKVKRRMEISVNEKPVYSGVAVMGEDLSIPSDSFQKGLNYITVKNLTPAARSQENELVEFLAACVRTETWGWFLIDSLYIAYEK